MTAIRQSIIDEIERLPEGQIIYVLQIIKGINRLYDNGLHERKKEAFDTLDQLRKKGTITDYKRELAEYRDERYAETVN